ncbi:hypothetical protein [Mycobacterium sp. SMC-13]|uniref:hypothetical protein n=1 Tax=Mycobacterium sp. SMC-13 TaxID=3381626 RepID=UPI00387773FD
MNSSVLPWIKKTVFAHTESDQCVADRERLEHECAVLREENAELRCRIEELEASVEFHSEQRLQAIARAGIERVRS